MKRKHSGSILIVVLFVMAILSLTAVSLAYRVGLGSRTMRDEVLVVQLRARAQSAAAVAMARLLENTNDYDHRAELWYSPLSSLPDGVTQCLSSTADPADPYEVDCRVIDEQAKLNIMFASSEALTQLGMSAEQMAAVFDWMDSDQMAQAQGAEDEYYQNNGLGYHAKNAPMDCLHELLLIRGFTLSDYWGEDDNHNGLLDAAENDGVAFRPMDNADGELTLGWVDVLTCVGDGRININTAPRQVLQTLPISEEAIGQIIGYRHFDGDSDGHLDDHAFRSASDIDQLQGLTDIERDILKQTTIFQSCYYRIFARAIHRPTGLCYQIEAVIHVEQDTYHILFWQAGLIL